MLQKIWVVREKRKKVTSRKELPFLRKISTGINLSIKILTGNTGFSVQKASTCGCDTTKCTGLSVIRSLSILSWHFSVSLYDAALQLCTTSTQLPLVVNITKRLGNVKNELGVLYMNKAAALIDSGAEPTLQERDLWKKSFSNFESGIRTFDVIDDRLEKIFSTFFSFISVALSVRLLVVWIQSRFVIQSKCRKFLELGLKNDACSP